MTKRYVLGFLIHGDKVMLILRTKQDWQRGQWNGIGGKVKEGETEKEAFYREMVEECAISLTMASIKEVCVVKGIDVDDDIPWEMTVFEVWWHYTLDFDPRITHEGVTMLVDRNAEPMDSTARWIIDFIYDRRINRLEVSFGEG